MGAVFVRELDAIPDDGQPVVFSAHGVPRPFPAEASAARCSILMRHARSSPRSTSRRCVTCAWGRTVLLVGHRGHPEVVGTMGQLPEGTVVLIETEEDVAAFEPADPQRSASSRRPLCRWMIQPVSSQHFRRSSLRCRRPPRSRSAMRPPTGRTRVKASAPGTDLFFIVGRAQFEQFAPSGRGGREGGGEAGPSPARTRRCPMDDLMPGHVIGMSAAPPRPKFSRTRSSTRCANASICASNSCRRQSRTRTFRSCGLCATSL